VYSCGWLPNMSRTHEPLFAADIQSSWRRVHDNSPEGHHHQPATP
jgi:hypothetical protein